MANKKSLMMLVLVGFVAGWSFAQTDSRTMPKNTVTVDFGPTIVGAAIKGIGNLLGEEGVSTSGFGIAAQYERQLLEKLSVAGRFAYLGGGMGYAIKEAELKAVLSINLFSFSTEGHVRFYPGDTFFLDGMLGYANMTTKFSGEVIGTNAYGIRAKESVSLKASRSYFNFGAKLGWRIDFGKPGGFIFEPSLGYYGEVGLGDTLGKRLSNDIKEDISDVDPLFKMLERYIFIGGPRFSLAFGWKF